MKAEWPAGGGGRPEGFADGIDPAPPPGTTCMSAPRLGRGECLTHRILSAPLTVSRSGVSHQVLQSPPADVRLAKVSFSDCNN